MKHRIQNCFVCLALLAAFFPAQSSLAAVAFSITPSVISNTYNGTLAFQVTGLPNTAPVVVQKFLDANTNGVVDGADLLWQQFQLADGTNSVFHNGATAVTNFNVPGDTDTTAGQITARLYPSFDFAQEIVGKYLFVLSSPGGSFAPITNSFSVTNFPFAQSFSGNVVSNGTSTTLSNAVVILFNPNVNGGPVGGTVANNSGAYSIKMPPGTYELLAIKSNYVANGSTSPFLTLSAGVPITTNLTMTVATRSISGKLVDASNATIGLGGVLLPVQTQNGGSGGGVLGLLGIAFTDTNGNFTARVTTNQWRIGGNTAALILKNYLTLQNKTNVDTSTGSVSGVISSLPKATAIFYGTVKDTLGNPLPGLALFSSDNNGSYETDGFTDTNGNYFAGAVGGLNSTTWQIQQDYGGPANYIYSQGTNGVTLTNGQAFNYNFTGILATNHITGNVKFNGTNVVGANVNANATIGGVQYNSNANTDTNGNYSMNVANGTWSVNLNCNGGNGSLDNILGVGNYLCPNSQNITINNNTGTVNFNVQACNGVQILTTTLTNGYPNVYYDQFAQASSCYPTYTWSIISGSLPPGLTGDPLTGEFYGTPTDPGTSTFTVQVTDSNNNAASRTFSLTIVGPPVLGTPSWRTNRFQMQFAGASNQNYTMQMSTNLSSTNWISLFVTNSPTVNSFLLTDRNATNKQRFYRILIGP